MHLACILVHCQTVAVTTVCKEIVATNEIGDGKIRFECLARAKLDAGARTDQEFVKVVRLDAGSFCGAFPCIVCEKR